MGCARRGGRGAGVRAVFSVFLGFDGMSPSLSSGSGSSSDSAGGSGSGSVGSTSWTGEACSAAGGGCFCGCLVAGLLCQRLSRRFLALFLAWRWRRICCVPFKGGCHTADLGVGNARFFVGLALRLDRFVPPARVRVETVLLQVLHRCCCLLRPLRRWRIVISWAGRRFRNGTFHSDQWRLEANAVQGWFA